jgi:hypothetical protein
MDNRDKFAKEAIYKFFSAKRTEWLRALGLQKGWRSFSCPQKGWEFQVMPVKGVRGYNDHARKKGWGF